MSLRVGVFLDISNLYHGARAVYKSKINYKELLNFVEQNVGKVSVAKAYGAQVTDEAEPFIRLLQKFGYTPVYKKAKQYGNKIKGDIDTLLTVDVIRHLEEFDLFFLGSADADFLPLIDYLLEKEKKVMVMGCQISHAFKDRADIACEIHRGLLCGS